MLSFIGNIKKKVILLFLLYMEKKTMVYVLIQNIFTDLLKNGIVKRNSNFLLNKYIIIIIIKSNLTC